MRPRKEIREMCCYSAPTSGRNGFLRLDFNENTKGIPNSLWKCLSLGLTDISVYPEYSGLEQAIAEYAGVKQAEVIACNGSDEAIRLAFDCFLENGAKVVLPWPSFAMLQQYARIAGGKIEKVPYGKCLGFPTKRVLKAIDVETDAIVLCSPNSPTGTTIALGDIERILKKAKQNNAMVLLDEAYYEFSGETAVDLIREFDNLVVTRTLSKAFGLAGLRLGYLVSCEENVQELRKVASPYSVNAIGARLGSKALQNRGYMKRYVAEVRAAKKVAERGLQELGLRFYPSKANFLLVRFGENCARIVRELREKGILVRDRSGYELLRGCARVTIGTIEQMRVFLEALEEILERKTLVFDMDGVLVDVSCSYRKAIQETVKFFTGKELSLQKIQMLKNELQINNDWELSKKMIELTGMKVSLKAIIKRFQELYAGKNFNGLIRNEKLLLRKNIVKQLAKKFELSIFTGRPRKEAFFALQKVGIEKYFKKVVAMEDVSRIRQKPNPFGLKKILGRRKNAFYLGDTLQDIRCAKNAGIKAIAILPPQDKSEKLRRAMLKAGAAAVLSNVNEIGKVIG